MAYDDILFRGTATATGSIVLEQIKGPATVRAGYGQPRLVGVRAFWHAGDADTAVQAVITYTNTNWTRSNKLRAANFDDETAQARSTYNYVDGKGFPVLQNSSFIVSAAISGTIDTGDTVTIDVIVTIDYDKVPAVNPANYGGCPIAFEVTQAAGASGAAGHQISLGSYDFLDPGIVYMLNEVATTNTNLGMAYLIVEGIQAQQGLTRILPLPANPSGIVPTLLGSVQIVKQSMQLSVISDKDLSSQIVPLQLEMVASANSIGA